MNAVEAVEKYIYDKLVGSSAITNAIAAGPGGSGKGVHRDFVPERYLFPAIVFQMLAGEDWNTQMNARGAVEFRFLVKAIGEGNKTALHSIAENIDQALHGIQLVVSGDYQVDSMRLRPYSQPVVEDGKLRHQVGGVYTIFWRPVN